MIRFSELKEQVKNFRLTALRSEEETYFEAVIQNELVQELAGKLKVYLGAAVFTGGEKLADNVKKIINQFGGINPGQTLYLLQENDTVILAMFWPWQDRLHTTLKMALLTKL